MNNLLAYYQKVRKHSELLCKPLQTEDYTPQSVIFASPPKWHLAHTTWFFEEMILKNYLPEYKIYNKSFSFLFNSYYNSIGQRIERGQRGLITRPSVDEVYSYRSYVDEHITKVLSQDIPEKVTELLTLGINHEQQHQELLLTDLKYTLSKNPTYPKYISESKVTSTNKEEGWLSVQEGVYTIGNTNEAFCFDNELGQHRVFLEPYQISKALVTNGEFIEFIEENGYSTPNFWLDEGWSWVNENNIQNPLYWHKTEGGWYHYTLAGLEKVNPDAILSHISFYEATAFAAFKGLRLPTEFEWEIASEQLNWGERWEWTNSAYLPYPHFKIQEGAVGEYNGKFMVNQMVLRGASVATSAGHSRKTYRNFFHPQYQWQFTGIRLAK